MADYNQTYTNATANGWTPVNGPSPFDSNQNTTSDGAIGWDDAICCDSTEFTVLPEGDYPFTVVKLERQHHPGSAKIPACGKTVLTIQLDGGPLGTTLVTENLFMHQKIKWKIKQFLVSIGQGKEEDEEIRPRWNEVPGAGGRCHVNVHEYQSTRGGDTRQRNQITRFYAADPGPGARPAGYANGQSAAAPVAQPATPAYGTAVLQPATPSYGAAAVPAYGAPVAQTAAPAYGTPAAQAAPTAPVAPAYAAPAAPVAEQTSMPMPAERRRYF